MQKQERLRLERCASDVDGGSAIQIRELDGTVSEDSSSRTMAPLTHRNLRLPQASGSQSQDKTATGVHAYGEAAASRSCVLGAS